MPAAGGDLQAWLEQLRAWRKAKPRPRGPVFGRRRGAAAGAADGIDWAERNQRALALRREFELDVARGNFVPREEMVAAWTARVMLVRQRSLSLPRLLATRCGNSPPEAVELEARTIIRDWLQEFSADGPLTPAPQLPPDAAEEPA